MNYSHERYVLSKVLKLLKSLPNFGQIYICKKLKITLEVISFYSIKGMLIKMYS